MTPSTDARAILGQRGNKLATFAAAIIDAKKKPAAIDAEAKSFLPWLDANAGPEMKAWNALLQKKRLESSSGKFSIARGYTFTHAVRGLEDDGCRLARVRSLFLAMSPILEEDEELHLATWFSTPGGNNVVWYSHQDEWEFQSPSASITSWLVGHLVKAADDEAAGVVIDKSLEKIAEKAERGKIKIPAHLDAATLQERTDWIVSLFLQIGEGDGLSRAPTMSIWAKEKTLTKKWPHLQAYWLLFHLVMDNREELADLVRMHEKRYPAARELAGWARDVLAGKKIKSKVWDEARVLGVRLRSFEAKKDFFTAGAKERLLAATKQTRVATAQAENARAADPSVKLPKLYVVCEKFAGRVAMLEQSLNDANHKDDPDAGMKIFLWNRRGNGTTLRSVVWPMTENVDPKLRDFFEAKVQAGAKFKETHEKNVLGSIACLGVAMGDWTSFAALITKLLGAPEKLQRLRRLELAVVAQRLMEAKKGGAGALAFLHREAERFVDQIDAFETDTTAAALGGLARRKDPVAIALVNRMFSNATYSGANWTTLIAFAQLASDVRDARFAPGLLAALKKELGRHDDGDRAIVARAYAAVAGASAIPVLEKLIAQNDDVRKECEHASLVAGLVEAAGEKYAPLAGKAIDDLLLKGVGSMESGAAISLLQAVHANGVAGFRDRAAKVLAAAKADKWTEKPLLKWLAGATFE